MMYLRGLPVFLLLLPLAGCMSAKALAQRNTLAGKGDRSITCRAGADCEDRWARAEQWVKSHSAYEITAHSDTLIETAGPSGVFDGRLGFTVTKKPDFTNAVPDTEKIAFFPRCDNWLGCAPTALEAKASFADFVIGAPPAAKPALGVKVVPIGTQGLGITSIAPGSPAEKSGLSENDIIVRYDGKPVLTEEALERLVANTPPGGHAVIDIVRGRAPRTVTVNFPPAAAK